MSRNPHLLEGAAAEKARAACLAQLAEWGLQLPLDDIIMRHFALPDFYETGEIEFWIVNRGQEDYCGKFIFVFDGQTCPLHHHRRKHETFFVVRGRLRFTVNGEPRELQQGDVLPMAPGNRHSFTGIGAALILEISRSCIKGDNVFEDQRIAAKGRYDHPLLLERKDRQQDGPGAENEA